MFCIRSPVICWFGLVVDDCCLLLGGCWLGSASSLCCLLLSRLLPLLWLLVGVTPSFCFAESWSSGPERSWSRLLPLLSLLPHPLVISCLGSSSCVLRSEVLVPCASSAVLLVFLALDLVSLAAFSAIRRFRFADGMSISILVLSSGPVQADCLEFM